MGVLPIEAQAREHVENDADLNIHRGRIAALKALMQYIKGEDASSDSVYVPDIPPNDPRLADINLQQYNSIRNQWIAMYQSWQYPDLFVVVECASGSIYTQVNKHVSRASDHSQATLW